MDVVYGDTESEPVCIDDAGDRYGILVALIGALNLFCDLDIFPFCCIFILSLNEIYGKVLLNFEFLSLKSILFRLCVDLLILLFLLLIPASKFLLYME